MYKNAAISEIKKEWEDVKKMFEEIEEMKVKADIKSYQGIGYENQVEHNIE